MILGSLLQPLFRQLAANPSGRTMLGSAVVKHWPSELLVGLERARLMEPGPASKSQICPGCTHACVLSVSYTSEGGFIHCNQPDVDYGLIELEPSEQRQWHASRHRIVAFIARELNLSPSDRDDRAVHIRFGSWAGARISRALALEFRSSAIVRIGDADIELSELMKWDGARVRFDHEQLEIRANLSADAQTGGKRYQQSRLKQRYRAGLTQLRNLRLQEMADQLKRGNSLLKKANIAKAITATGEFGNMNAATVARIIRIPTNLRRK